MTLAGSVILGWVFERTRGSVPVCACLHAAINAGATALVVGAGPMPSGTLLWTYSLGYAVAALLGVVTV